MALNEVQTSFDSASDRLMREIEQAIGERADTPPTFEHFTPSCVIGRRYLGVTVEGMMFAVEVTCLGPA